VSLAHHAREVCRRHFTTDGSLHDAADLLQVLPEVPRFFRQQRRVRGDAVDDAECGDGLDVLDAAGVYEQFSWQCPFSITTEHTEHAEQKGRSSR